MIRRALATLLVIGAALLAAPAAEASLVGLNPGATVSLGCFVAHQNVHVSVVYGPRLVETYYSVNVDSYQAIQRYDPYWRVYIYGVAQPPPLQGSTSVTNTGERAVLVGWVCS